MNSVFFLLLLSSLLISTSSHHNFSQYVCACVCERKFITTQAMLRLRTCHNFFSRYIAAHTFQFLCSVFVKLVYVEWFISGTSYTRWKTMNQKISKRRRNNSKSNRSDCYCTQVSIHEVWRQPSNARIRKRGRWRRKQKNRSRKMNINFLFGLPLYRIETKYPS